MAIPQSLQDRLKHRRVVPFVGAGVSMSVRDRISQHPVFPSWRQLLDQAADRLEQENKKADANLVQSLLSVSPPEFLEAASRARKALGGVWYEFLKEQIDIDFQRIDPESLELARHIWRLGSNLIITTNYDEVLKWACPHPGLQSWDIEAPVEQASLLRGELKRPVIWHLHGRINKASELILSRDAYHLLYPDTNHGDRKSHYEAALRTLQHQLATKSLLFVGFSLDDEYLGLQLKDVHELYHGAGIHYALVRKEEAGRVRDLNAGIEPITFSDFGEQALAMFRQFFGEHDQRTTSVATKVARYLVMLDHRKEAYDLVTHYLSQIPAQDPSKEILKRWETVLLSTTIRKGFGSNPKKQKSGRRKGADSIGVNVTAA